MMVSRGYKYGAAQAVIDKIECSRAKRSADEEHEELDEILKRIRLINESYELNRSCVSTFRPNGFQYVADLEELEDLLKDQVKRRRFFVNASNQFGDEFDELEADDLDLEFMSLTMKETFESAGTLADKLGEINRDLIQLLVQLEQKKTAKGRKKLEAALQQAKDNIASLNETLLRLHHDGCEKDERLQQLVAQIDIKNKELLKLKNSAVNEVTMKNAAEVEQLKSIISNRDSQIVLLEADVQRLEKELVRSAKVTESERLLLKRQDPGMASAEILTQEDVKIIQHQSPHSSEKTLSNLKDSDNLGTKESDLSTLEPRDNNEKDEGSASRGIAALTSKSPSLPSCNLSDKTLTGSTENAVVKDSKVEAVPHFLLPLKDSGKLTVGKAQTQGRANDSKTSNVNVSKTESKTIRKTSVNKHDVAKNSSALGVSAGPRLSGPGVGPSESCHSLVAVAEEDHQTALESVDLKDEDSWAKVLLEESPLRFAQYRKRALGRIAELEDQIEVIVRKTREKVETLRLQFQDQKTKWEAERKTLVENLSQLNRYQMEANQDIGIALSHLENLVGKHSSQLPQLTDKSDVMLAIENKSPSPVQCAVSEVNSQAKDETLDESDRLEKMTDDAKVQMSRESTRLSSEETRDFLIHQITAFDQQKPDMVDEAYKAVGYQKENKSTSPINFWPDFPDVENHHETMVVIRQRMEERLTKTGQWLNSSDVTSTAMNEEFSTDGPAVADGDFEGHEKSLSNPSASPTRLNRESTADTLQSSQIFSSAVSVILEEYLKSYDDLVAFRQNLKSCLPINGLSSSFERFDFDRDAPLKPQIIHLSQSINKILREILDCLLCDLPSAKLDESINITSPFMMHTHGPPTLFLNHGTQSVDQELDVENLLPSQNIDMVDLRSEYEKVQNSVIVSEMQDTIGHLKRELSSLRLKAAGLVQSNQHYSGPSPSPLTQSKPVIFTRLDSERNVKIMRKAIVEQRISIDQCKAVLNRMRRYTEIPSQRLRHLVCKYMCHQNLMEIQENLNLSQSTDGNLLQLLMKMEAYHQKRLEKFDERSRILDDEREHLAKELTDILSNIEFESGIFLIKPIYSYKGSISNTDLIQNHHQKRTRTYQPLSSLKMSTRPHTPLLPTGGTPSQRSLHGVPSGMLCKPRDHQLEHGVQGSAKPLLGIEATGPMWKQIDSTYDQVIDSRSQPNVPHLLELDINRVIIGNNTISTRFHQNPSPSAVLNPSSQIVSYVATNRPSASAIQFRSSSVAGLNSVPPSSPAPKTGKERIRVFHSARTSPTSGILSIIASSPLPPIASAANDKNAADELPESKSISSSAEEDETEERKSNAMF